MRKILINLIHPNINESRINKALSKKISKLDNVTINDIYENYPDFNIDVKKEQELLLNHDIIVFQFPFYWFSAPGIMKEWFDKVLEYGFAYGETYSLENKTFAVVTSTGGACKDYNKTGENKYSVEDYLAPFEGTANYIKMNYKEPFITYASLVLDDEELEDICNNYVDYIKSL